ALADLSLNSTLTFLQPGTTDPLPTHGSSNFRIIENDLPGGNLPPDAQVEDPFPFIFDIPGVGLISGTTYVNMRMESPHSSLWNTGSLISIPIDGAAYGRDVSYEESSSSERNSIAIKFYVTDTISSARPIAPIDMHPNADD